MSIVPLILSGDDQTIVTSQKDFQLKNGIDGNVIYINQLDSTQLHNDNEANSSYDLRVGAEYRDHRDIHKLELGEGGTIKLLPRSAVVIQTEEHVHFPKNRFGQILPKVGLLQDGISNTTSKVDPGYHGNLNITIFNLGQRTIHLKRGQKFCSLVIHEILPGSRPYDKQPKRIEGRNNGGNLKNFRDNIEANGAFIGAAALVVSIILAIVQLYALIM